jgi:hypothetical protein
LAGAVEPDAVRASLDYLRRALDSLGTPLALGWTLIGLSAWGERPADAEARIVECIERQGRFGGYATSHLSILPIARHSVDGAPIALAPMGGAA